MFILNQHGSIKINTDSVITWLQHQCLSLLARVEAIAWRVPTEGHEGGRLSAVILMLGGHPDVVWDKTIRVWGNSRPISFP